jgi:3'(2'), 5'-bisphosphate nucleotidase
MNNIKSHLTVSIRSAVLAGKEILSVYERETEIEFKDDKSPLTIADKLSHQKISEGLLTTGLPILSEEGKSIDFNERKNWKLFWMVDPLDGTKEFIKKNGEFTVNIALIKDGIPVLGVVYAPVLNTIYFGAENFGSYKFSASVSELIKLTSDNDYLEALVKESLKLPVKNTKETYTVVASRSHLTPETEAFINELKAKHGAVDFISKGSSLKICLVTEGAADIYPRLAPTMEWDTAAGQAVALYAGKSVKLFKNNEAMKYNKENLLNEWFVVS